MKKFIKKIKSNKALHILSILIIGVFFILAARVTFAFLAPVINSAQTDVVGTSDTVDDFKFELGDALNIDATPTTLPENGNNYVTSTTAKALLKANSTKNTATYNYYVYFEIKSNAFTYSDGTTPEIILTITDPNGDEITAIDNLTYGTFNGVSGFDVTTAQGLINIANNYEITSNSSTSYTTQEWNITLTYLNLPIDQSANYGNSMGVNVYLQKNEFPSVLSDVCTNGDNLANCITTLSQKSVSGATNIYYHDSSLTNGAGDNSYRYTGPSDNVNNFVCFGSTESPCPTDNLYRIIGVINGKVKLIKYDYMTTDELGTGGDYYGAYTIGNSTYKGNNYANIASYYWNYKADTSNYNNTWSTSLLNKTNLNTNFINYLGEEWSNKISTTTWKVGGTAYDRIEFATPSVVYQNEILNPNPEDTSITGETEYEAKIGLMYVSDYGFAASPSAWTLTMSSYNNTTATSNNWMYMGLYEWTISRDADGSSYAFGVFSDGSVNVSRVLDGVAGRASFNLESSITYKSGSGSMSDPIIIN